MSDQLHLNDFVGFKINQLAVRIAGTMARSYSRPYGIGIPAFRIILRLGFLGSSSLVGLAEASGMDPAVVMVTMVDDAIGRILAALENLSLSRNTVIIFTADHGDMGGEHGLFGKFGVHYEAVLKVPFIWNDPDLAPEGRTDMLGGTIDIGSSILARAGVANTYGVQGFDIVSLARTDKAPERAGIISEEDQVSEQVNGMGAQRIWSFIHENWRLSLWYGDDTGHLFDRESDPAEMNNLWFDPAYEEKKAELMELMLRERMRLEDTLPLTTRFA